jgi:hypothetical protein
MCAGLGHHRGFFEVAFGQMGVWLPDLSENNPQAKKDRETERQRDNETERQRNRMTKRQRYKEWAPLNGFTVDGIKYIQIESPKILFHPNLM